MAETTLTADSQAATSTASPAPKGSEQSPQPQQKQQAKPAEATKASPPDGKAESKGAAESLLGQPGSYELASPEDLEIDAGALSAFTTAARDLNLSQEAAQKMLATIAPAWNQSVVERQQAAHEKLREEWTKASQTDQEFGRDRLDESIGIAKKALGRFGSPTLGKLLNESGLGNHPEVIRFFLNVGRAISEDSKVVQGAAPGSTRDLKDPKVQAQILYGGTK